MQTNINIIFFSQIIEELKEENDTSFYDSLLELNSSEKQSVINLRKLVASKTQEIESLKRLIDDVPGRAELSQYQKRFLELYSLGELEICTFL